MYLSTAKKYLSTVLNYTLKNVLISTCTKVHKYLSTVLKYKVLKYRPSMIVDITNQQSQGIHGTIGGKRGKGELEGHEGLGRNKRHGGY